MPNSLQDWTASAEFALLGFLIGVISFVAAFIFYFNAKRERLPTYQSLTSVLVEGGPTHPDGLTLAYKGQPQQRIAITKMAFWNAGHETIRRSDLVAADPLRIEIQDALILDAMLLKISAESCNFSLSIVEPAQCDVSFDYIDFRDYALIQLVHTGTGDAKVRLKGKILGTKKLRHVEDPTQDFERSVALSLLSKPPVVSHHTITFFAIVLAIGLFQLYRGNFAWYVWGIVAYPALFLVVSAVVFRAISPARLR